MDQCLACRRSTAYGELLERTAVASHGMAFEVSQNKHGIIVENVLAQIVFLQDLAVRDGPDHIRTFRVHQVNSEDLVPAVILDQCQMLRCMVPYAAEGIAIGCIAFHDGAVHFLHHRLPEIRTQEVLVSFLAGMHLDRDFAGEVDPQQMIHLNYLFGSDLPGKINLRCHLSPSFIILFFTTDRS